MSMMILRQPFKRWEFTGIEQDLCQDKEGGRKAGVLKQVMMSLNFTGLVVIKKLWT